MNKGKKIGLLIPNLQSGGAERVLSIISNLLVQEGYDIYFLLFDTTNISYEYSGKLVNLNCKAGSNIVTSTLIRIIRIVKLSYFKNKYNLDIVISFLYSANVVNYFSIGRAKKILACRGYGDFYENGEKYSRMMENVYAFIVQTERMKLEFTEDFNIDESRIKVVYNPFNVKQIARKAKEVIEEEVEYFIKTHKTICTIGAFKKDKGYWHLMKAFVEVKKTVRNAGLIFIGSRGEMENDIKKMATMSGFEEDILFLGYQENPFKYASKCDLYVCSSIFEGFPNAIVEAMASGIAVLSADCKTGPRELLCETIQLDSDISSILYADYGILVSKLSSSVSFDYNNISNDDKLLARAITETLESPNLIENYKNQSLKGVQRYNIETFKNQLIEIIEGISS